MFLEATKVIPPPIVDVERGAHVVLARGDTIKPEPIQWLWNGWLAAGKFHVLAGAPGTGKTTIALAMAATITTGGRWPDGSICKRGSVLIWSGEDSPTDTLAPRLLAMGADMKRVFFIEGRHDDAGNLMSFDPANDTAMLASDMQKNKDIRLLIVDPIVSAVSGDSHKNAEVRRGLQPLVDLGANHDCAILGINHFSKGTAGRDPTERVTGSLAFGALARLVLVTVKSKDAAGKETRIIARSKSNIGPDNGGFNYALQSADLMDYPGVITSAVLWGAAIEGEARDILATMEEPAKEGDGKVSAVDEAADWLEDFLAEGPKPQTEIKDHSEQEGHSWAAMRRAKKQLGVTSEKLDMQKGWLWKLHEGAQEKLKVLTPESEHLQESLSTFTDSEKTEDLALRMSAA